MTTKESKPPAKLEVLSAQKNQPQQSWDYRGWFSVVRTDDAILISAFSRKIGLPTCAVEHTTPSDLLPLSLFSPMANPCSTPESAWEKPSAHNTGAFQILTEFPHLRILERHRDALYDLHISFLHEISGKPI